MDGIVILAIHLHVIAKSTYTMYKKVLLPLAQPYGESFGKCLDTYIINKNTSLPRRVSVKIWLYLLHFFHLHFWCFTAVQTWCQNLAIFAPFYFIFIAGVSLQFKPGNMG